MADGNMSRIIVWVNDTVIVKKQLEGKSLYFVADAVTGQPVPKANVEFFGWKQVHVAAPGSTASSPRTFTADHRRRRPAAARPGQDAGPG